MFEQAGTHHRMLLNLYLKKCNATLGCSKAYICIYVNIYPLLGLQKFILAYISANIVAAADGSRSHFCAFALYIYIAIFCLQ